MQEHHKYVHTYVRTYVYSASHSQPFGHTFTDSHSTPSTVTTLLQSMDVVCTHKDVLQGKYCTLRGYLHLSVHVYIWVHLGAFGCIWVHLGASGCIWVILVQSVCKEVHVFADSLVLHDVGMHVHRYIYV